MGVFHPGTTKMGVFHPGTTNNGFYRSGTTKMVCFTVLGPLKWCFLPSRDPQKWCFGRPGTPQKWCFGRPGTLKKQWFLTVLGPSKQWFFDRPGTLKKVVFWLPVPVGVGYPCPWVLATRARGWETPVCVCTVPWVPLLVRARVHRGHCARAHRAVYWPPRGGGVTEMTHQARSRIAEYPCHACWRDT